MVSAQDNELFVIDADTTSDLISKCEDLGKSVKGISYAELTDLAAALGRQANIMKPLRAAFIAGNPDELVEKFLKLKKFNQKQPTHTLVGYTRIRWNGFGSATRLANPVWDFCFRAGFPKNKHGPVVVRAFSMGT